MSDYPSGQIDEDALAQQITSLLARKRSQWQRVKALAMGSFEL